MKTMKMTLLLMLVAFMPQMLSAQVSLDLHLGSPSPDRYYYLQDVGAYYDTQASMYIYLTNGRWLRGRSLPASYGHYDFDNGHKVLIKDYRGSRPYDYYRSHSSRFPRDRYDAQQPNYWSAKEHKSQMKNDRKSSKQYNKSMQRENKGNGNNGNGRGNGKGGNGGGNGRGKGGGK